MNELVVAPENTIVTAKSNNLFNNKFILFIPLFFVLSNTVKNSPIKTTAFSDILNKLPNLIDFENFGEKVEVLKKIGPYLPESAVGPVNTIIISLDRIHKVIGLMDVVSVNKVQKPIVAIENLSNKERINHILATINEEMPEEKIKNIKPILDIALNLDKYKAIVSMMSTLGSMPNKTEKQANQTTQNNQNNRSMQLDQMINAIKPMLGEDADKGMDKVKEMMQMFEILNVLNTPDKETSDQ